jgi:hypothetical protein
MSNGNTRVCGQIFVKKLNKKIWVHAKKGESCAEARKRVAENWEADTQTAEPEASRPESAEGSSAESEVANSAE